MAKKKGSMLGGWAFLIGVVLAVILGLLGALTQTMLVILVIAGLIVGLLNVAEKETAPFLLAGAVLIIASSLAGDVLAVIPSLQRVLDALLVLIVPAVIVVAVKHVFGMAKG
jgi:hypothetical protein